MKDRIRIRIYSNLNHNNKWQPKYALVAYYHMSTITEFSLHPIVLLMEIIFALTLLNIYIPQCYYILDIIDNQRENEETVLNIGQFIPTRLILHFKLYRHRKNKPKSFKCFQYWFVPKICK